MTNQNKYLKYYNSIIERAKKRDKLMGYVEKHHIIPRCMGGSDDTDNLVELTPEEHYTCHLLLIKIYPDNSKLLYAANMMMVSPNNNLKRVGNKKYGWLKKRIAKDNSKRFTKPMPPKDELYKLYVTDRLSSLKIAEMYNVTDGTCTKWLNLYNIEVRTAGDSLTKIFLQKEELKKYYIDNKMTMKEISKLYNCSFNVIRKHLLKYNIPIRKKSYWKKVTIPSKEELLDLYMTKNLNIADIGKLYGVSTCPVNQWFKFYNIISKEPKDYIVIPPPSKEELVELYINQNSRLQDIADLYKVKARDTVRKWLVSHGISIRERTTKSI
jgi:transposase-like protein